MPSNELLTEDGHPIGEIVVANNPLERPAPPDTTREELLKSELSELTGDMDGDAAIAELYEGYLDKVKRGQALRMYVAERKPLGDIAKAVGVPPRTVSMWAYNGRWDAVMRREIQAEQEQSLLKLVDLRNARREKAAIDQLDAARIIRERTLDQLRHEEVSVRNAAEALKSAADVEARILGIAESGALDRGEKSEAGKAAEKTDGKTPLVMVFQGGLPPVRVSKPSN